MNSITDLLADLRRLWSHHDRQHRQALAAMTPAERLEHQRTERMIGALESLIADVTPTTPAEALAQVALAADHARHVSETDLPADVLIAAGSIGRLLHAALPALADALGADLADVVPDAYLPAVAAAAAPADAPGAAGGPATAEPDAFTPADHDALIGAIYPTRGEAEGAIEAAGYVVDRVPAPDGARAADNRQWHRHGVNRDGEIVYLFAAVRRIGDSWQIVDPVQAAGPTDC